jgi:hypothetical protein
MDDDMEAERARRRAQIGREIRVRQSLLMHDSPVPAFLNWVTERIIDIELRLEKLEERGS